MDDPELARIDAIQRAAVPGPWKALGGIVQGPPDAMWAGRSTNLATAQDEATASFIASARQDVPALLAEVRRLRRLVARRKLTDPSEP
jgi:hypothetical protein